METNEVQPLNALHDDSSQQLPFNPDVNKKNLALWLQLAGTLASVGVNAYSNWNSNRINRSINRENNAFNAQQSLDAFNRNTAYNSPSAEMQRLQSAGINPALYYNGGSASVEQHAASAASPIANQPFNIDPSVISQLRVQDSLAALQSAQARNLDAQTDMIPVQQERLKAEIERLSKQNEETSQYVKLLTSKTNLTDQQVVLAGKELEKLQGEIRLLERKCAESEAYTKTLEKRIEVMKADIEEKNAHSKYFQALTTMHENRNSLWDDEKEFLKSGWSLGTLQNQIDKRYADAHLEALTPEYYVDILKTFQYGIVSSYNKSQADARKNYIDAEMYKLFKGRVQSVQNYGNSQKEVFGFLNAYNDIMQALNGDMHIDYRADPNSYWQRNRNRINVVGPVYQEPHWWNF